MYIFDTKECTRALFGYSDSHQSTCVGWTRVELELNSTQHIWIEVNPTTSLPATLIATHPHEIPLSPLHLSLQLYLCRGLMSTNLGEVKKSMKNQVGFDNDMIFPLQK
jgi:hypothetical protein